MAGEHRVDIADYTRVRYFNGLFLKEADFTLDQRFHIVARRYLNYLLFKPGRLYTADTTPPLQVTAAGTSITLSPGTALISNDAQRVAYEVHLANAVTLDLSTASFGFTAGDTVQVTLEFAEAQRDSGTGAAGGAGVLVPGNDRWVEQAVIRLRRTAPAPDPPSGNSFIVLADIVFTAPMSNTNVTNTSGRGGVRLEILSDDVRALLSGGPSPATLTGITLSPPGPLSLTVGNTATLTATGHFDTGPDRPLTPAGDGLLWSSSNMPVATVSTAGVVNAVTPGSADITAAVGAISATLTVTVTAAIVVSVTSFMPTSGPVGTTVTITGTGFATGATVAFGGIAATVVSVDSATQITATVPTGATTGPIAVTVGSDTATSGASFTVTVDVDIVGTNVSAQSSGATVVIRGTNIRNSSIVPGAQAAGTTIRLNATGVVPPFVDPVASTIIALADAAGLQRVQFTMPTRHASWAANQPVMLRLEFGGGFDEISFAYDD